MLDMSGRDREANPTGRSRTFFDWVGDVFAGLRRALSRRRPRVVPNLINVRPYDPTDDDLAPPSHSQPKVARDAAAAATSAGPSSGIVSANTGSHGRKYVSRVHSHTVVGGLQRFRIQGTMCDTLLIAEGQTFSVHRSYLAACSQYFCAMFASNFEERNQKQVELKGVTATGLRVLLDYAYTGSIIINDSNLQNVLEAADHLQFTEVRLFCGQYLLETLTKENCLDALNMTHMYGLECEPEVKNYILENFVPVAQNEDFKTISLNLFLELLSDDKLRAPSELDVFYAALKWLENNRSDGDAGNQDLSKKVLSLIRYGLIDPEEMDVVYGNPLMLRESCREVLKSALHYHMNLFSQPIIDTPIARMRDYKESLVIVGAEYHYDIPNDQTLTAIARDCKFENFCQLTHANDRRCFPAVAVVNDFVYVVGGQMVIAGNYDDYLRATNSAFRYNPRDGKWLQISPMTVPRTDFALIIARNCLVAVGGVSPVKLSSAEKYNFVTNEWSTISSLPYTLFGHAGCSHVNRVYISGGRPAFIVGDYTDEVHCYDFDKDGWEYKANMNQSRSNHVMVSHRDVLFAYGGTNNVAHQNCMKTTECYNIESDQWTIVKPAPYAKFDAPWWKCGSKIYILGGYSWDAHSFQEKVQCYDLDNDEWEVIPSKLDEPLYGFAACHVKLPINLHDETLQRSAPM